MRATTVRIAWRNLGRNRRRTALALAAIALGQLTVVFVNGLMAGSFKDIMRTITGPLVGHVQIQHPDWREERAVDLYVGDLERLREEIRSVSGVVSVSARLYAPVLTARDEESGEVVEAEPGMIVGVDMTAEAVRGGILESLSPEQVPGPGSVAVGKVLARRLGLKAGDRLALIGQDVDGFPASGLFEVKAVLSSKADIVNRNGIVMPLEAAADFLALPDAAHEILVMGQDHEKAPGLAAAIKRLSGLANLQILTWREAVPDLASLVDTKTVFDLIFVALLMIAAAAGIANTSMMSTYQRTKEFGMLLALGCRPARIARMILTESVMIGIAGVVIGSLLGSALVLITGHTGIDYTSWGGPDTSETLELSFKGVNFSYVVYPEFEWRHIFMGMAAVSLISVLASAWPAVLAARLRPVEAMRP